MARVGATRRNELTERQEPFAIVLGCSDSRVPAEIVFDQGLGDLFVIRVAGNIVAPSQIGSVEFAAEQFHTRLVVVLGHSGCGAILATIEQLKRPVEKQSRNLRAIVDRVRPSVEPLLATALRDDPQALVRNAVRANVRASASNLRHGSEILEQLIERDGLLVVGAEYSLETGVVEFFEGLPASAALGRTAAALVLQLAIVALSELSMQHANELASALGSRLRRRGGACRVCARAPATGAAGARRDPRHVRHVDAAAGVHARRALRRHREHGDGLDHHDLRDGGAKPMPELAERFSSAKSLTAGYAAAEDHDSRRAAHRVGEIPFAIGRQSMNGKDVRQVLRAAPGRQDGARDVHDRRPRVHRGRRRSRRALDRADAGADARGAARRSCRSRFAPSSRSASTRSSRARP